MMPRILTTFFCLLFMSAQSQVLRDINYNYRYNQNGLFQFSWKVLKEDNVVKVFYELVPSDTTQELKDLTVLFETRESLSEKNGTSIPTSPGYKQGKSTFGSTSFTDSGQKIIVAKVSLLENGKTKSYLFYKSIPKSKSIFISASN